MAVGTLSSVISRIMTKLPDYGMLLKFLMIPLNELPWATTNTFFPDLIAGTFSFYHSGITRSIVVFKLCKLRQMYLSEGKLFWIDILIPLIEMRTSLILRIQLWWRNVKASPPNLDLFFSMLFHSLKLVQSLKSTVMSFVESPILDNWDIVTVKFVSSIVESLNCSTENGSIDHVEVESVLFKNFSCFGGFLNSIEG